MDTSEQWFTLDNRDGPIWGSRGPGFNPGSPTGEWPCRRRIDGCGSGAFQASTSFCIHCDAPPPDKPELSTEAAAAFERVLSAEPELRAAVDIVEVLRQLVRPTDRLCHGCLWESIIKPMVRPYLGYGRGYPPKSAKDPNPDRAWEIISAAEMWARGDTGLPAETETEKWLRTSEVWDAFTDVLMTRLYEYDPANGCRVGRATDARALSR